TAGLYGRRWGWQVARILVVQHDYPPEVGGYGLLCAEVCSWLGGRGHEVLVLSAVGGAATAPPTDPGLTLRRALIPYGDGARCPSPPYREALQIERANREALLSAIRDLRPELVSFWHMGALSLGLITAAARRGLPAAFVIGDDWLCYG